MTEQNKAEVQAESAVPVAVYYGRRAARHAERARRAEEKRAARELHRREKHERHLALHRDHGEGFTFELLGPSGESLFRFVWRWLRKGGEPEAAAAGESPAPQAAPASGEAAAPQADR